MFLFKYEREQPEKFKTKSITNPRYPIPQGNRAYLFTHLVDEREKRRMALWQALT
jgi:hypothetical protein